MGNSITPGTVTFKPLHSMAILLVMLQVMSQELLTVLQQEVSTLLQLVEYHGKEHIQQMVMLGL